MTGKKIQIRNTPSYLKGLAETRARADADVLRLQKSTTKSPRGWPRLRQSGIIPVTA